MSPSLTPRSACDRCHPEADGAVRVEGQVGGQRVGDEHAALAEDRACGAPSSATASRRRELKLTPLSRRPVTSTRSSCSRPILCCVCAASALDRRGAEPAHEVEVVRREVLDDADVAHAVRERADALGRDQEHVAELALLHAAAQLEQRGVEALDVADGAVHAGAAQSSTISRACAVLAASGFSTSTLTPRGDELAHGRRGGPRSARRRSRSRARPRASSSAAGRTRAPGHGPRRERSPAGSTAPANATRPRPAAAGAWWRPIIPRPSTAPRSGRRSEVTRG